MCGCFESKNESGSGVFRYGATMADRQEQKLKDAEKMLKKADKLTKLSFFNWAADWGEATPLYEQAGLAFKTAKLNEKAKHCFEKAATGQERLCSCRLEEVVLRGFKGMLVRFAELNQTSVEMMTLDRLSQFSCCLESTSKDCDDYMAHKAFQSMSRQMPIVGLDVCLSNRQWTAAKHLESAGGLAKELEDWPEVADLYKRASDLYKYCGKPQPAADALVRGARAIEDAIPDDAIGMYLDSCSLLEDDGREQMAFDTYRASTNLYIKLHRYPDAASMLLRWGQAADKCKAVQSQCKAYVSAIIVYLYCGDLKAAEHCYSDCSQIDAFLNSEQNQLAEKLLQAYRDSDGDEVMYIIKSSKTIPHLDHMIVRLAKQLPVGGLKPAVGSSNGDDLDESDLT